MHWGTKWVNPLRPVTRLLVAGWFVFAAHPAASQASVLIGDGFVYPDGALTDHGWTAYSDAGLKTIQVISEEVRLECSAGAAEDVSVPLGAPRSATDKTYLGAIIRVPSTAPGGGAPAFSSVTRLVQFLDDSGVRHVSAAVGAPGGVPRFYLVEGGAAIYDPGLPALVFDEAFRVICAFDASNGDVAMWVNPVDESSAHILVPDWGTIGAILDRLAMEQRTTTTANHYAFIDHVVAADNFAEVQAALAGPAVPASSTLVLAGLTVLFAGAGAWMIRRREPDPASGIAT